MIRFYKKPTEPSSTNATVTGSKHGCTLSCRPDSLTESTRKMLRDRGIDPASIFFDTQEKLECFVRENPGVKVAYPNETPRYTKN